MSLKSLNIGGAALATCAAMLLQGCMSTQVEPTSGPRAQMRVASSLGGSVVNVNVLSFANEQCDMPTLVASLSGAAVQHNRKKIGMPLAEEFRDRDISELYLPVDRPFIFGMSLWVGSPYTGASECRKTLVLQPAEGQMYEAKFSLAGDVCEFRVSKLEKRGDTYVRVPATEVREAANRCSIDGIVPPKKE